MWYCGNSPIGLENKKNEKITVKGDLSFEETGREKKKGRCMQTGEMGEFNCKGYFRYDIEMFERRLLLWVFFPLFLSSADELTSKSVCKLYTVIES